MTTREHVQPIGPDMAIDMNYAMVAWIAPAIATYIHEKDGRIDTSLMREDIARALRELNAAVGVDDEAYLRAAARVSGIAALIVYMRTSEAGCGK